MSSTVTYFEQAELALAAYFNFTEGMARDDYEAALRDNGDGMSPAQASAFAAKWNVVDQYTDLLTGVSATVFQAVSGGPKHLAIRGTQGPTDFLSNGLILLGFPPELTFQYPVLKAQVQAWLADPTVLQGQSFTVAGHSLGGFLAAGLVADFGASVSHAYLYNTPGYNVTHSLIAQALGFSNTPDASPSPAASHRIRTAQPISLMCWADAATTSFMARAARTCWTASQPRHQQHIRQRALHRTRNANRITQRHIFFSALHRADVGAMQARLERQRFLRPAQ